LLFCAGFVGSAYRFEWSATGFLNKSLWDWLQLLVVPLVLAIVALVFQLANTHTERQIAQQRYEQDQQIAKQRYEQDQQIALDKQQEDLLQVYLDRISELLLKESLRTSPSEEVRNVARVRTITVLTQLNARRIGHVFTFLREAGLMSTASTSNVVSLKHANLRAVKWGQADLSDANLSGAIFSQEGATMPDGSIHA
jgi:Pentapeptide repeats (8 copies)